MQTAQSVTCAKCVKKMKKKIGMIEFAIDSGWVLTTSKNSIGYAATIHKKGFDPIFGVSFCGLAGALENLSNVIERDYEESMIEESNVKNQAKLERTNKN